MNGECSCGGGPACITGDMCTPGGALPMECGVLCCGVSGACPL